MPNPMRPSSLTKNRELPDASVTSKAEEASVLPVDRTSKVEFGSEVFIPTFF